MAKFTEGVRPSSDPSYIGLSKEPDKQKPNAMWGELFSGIGEVGSLAVAATDQHIQNKLKTEVYEGVDPLRDAQGVAAGVAAAERNQPLNIENGGTPNPPPKNPMIEASNTSVARLAAAYQSGAISTTHYASQLEALSRQIRSRFPGYREEVDSMIQRATGMNPANTLRASLERDLAQAQSSQKSAADEQDKFVRNNPEHIPVDYYKRKAEGKPYSFTEVEMAVANSKRTEYDKQQKKLSFELAHSQGKFNREQALQTVYGLTNQIVDGTLVQSTEAGNIGKLMQMIQSGQTPKGFTPEEKVAVQVEFGKARMAVQQRIENELNAQGRSGQSWASMINDNGELEKVRAHAMKRLDMMEKALTDGNFGALAVQANIAKAAKDETTARLMGVDPIALAAGLQDISPVAAGIYYQQNIGKFSDAVNGLLTAQSMKRATGNSPGFSNDLTALKLAYPEGKVPGNVVKEAIDSAAKSITDPTVEPKFKVNHANSVYDDRNFGLIGRVQGAKQKSYVYRQLVSPATTKEMIKLKDTSAEGAQAFQNYEKFAVSGFRATLQADLDQITQPSNGMYQIRYDDKSGQFVPELTDQGKAYVKSGSFTRVRNTADPVEQLKIVMGDSWGSMQSINQNLAGLKPIFTAAGKDPNKAVGEMFEGMQIDPNGTVQKDTSKGFLNTLGDAVKSFFTEEEGDTEKTIRSRAGKDKRSDLNLDEAGGGRSTASRFLDAVNPVSTAQANVRSGVDLDNTDERLTSFASDISSRYNLQITSGYRDPTHNRRVGGARNSQHTQGRAVDMSLKGKSEQEKRQIIADLLTHPELGGIGYYPKSDSIHIDFRKGGKAAWGPDYHNTSLPSTPSWFRDQVEAWRDS
jgi:hypothetical protein